MMGFFVCSVLLVAGSELSVAIIREYSYHERVEDWYRARWVCRVYYRDLATITTEEEHQRLVSIGDVTVSAWVGLYTVDMLVNTWRWSDGETTTYLNWKPGWPVLGLSNLDKKYAVMYNGFLYNDPWKYGHPFYCYRYLILVNESRTWEEALQYCNTYYTKLASLPEAAQLQQASSEMALSQTDSVWTGLRFMDGQWFWLSGESLGTLVSVPQCPARPYHCGALDVITNEWQNRDCNEKLNFLCHWR